MYNYLDSIKADVLEAISNDYTLTDYESREQLEERLNDDLWIDDSVTGNASGSYTFSRATAEKYVRDNLDLVREMAAEFGISAGEIGERFLADDWEWFDVSIRCYLLGQAIAEALDELEEELEPEEIETEEERILAAI